MNEDGTTQLQHVQPTSKITVQLVRQDLDLEKLSQLPEHELLLSLMWVANDVLFLYDCARRSDRMRGELGDRLAQAERQSLMRLTCGVLREALKLVPEIQKCPRLVSTITNDPQAKPAWEYLTELGPKGKEKADFERFKSIRDRLAFHYKTDEIVGWFKDCLGRWLKKGKRIGLVLSTRGTHSQVLRYLFLDEMMEEILGEHALGHKDGISTQAAYDDATKLLVGITNALQIVIGAILADVMKQVASAAVVEHEVVEDRGLPPVQS